MIGRIKHKGLRLLFEENDWRELNSKHVERIRKILSALEAAESAEEVNTGILFSRTYR
jgi:toxin HigB-1